MTHSITLTFGDDDIEETHAMLAMFEFFSDKVDLTISSCKLAAYLLDTLDENIGEILRVLVYELRDSVEADQVIQAALRIGDSAMEFMEKYDEKGSDEK